ncbi:apses-domain-containing protein [Thozetella sp. PMI_491]|nr:apses-domain-containing protein [Thozetella sp. PMI_491]
MPKAGATEGVYSATYSGIPVWEFQFGEDLKEHVMRRRHDDWINATHILKAAGFDKPARTRILEREVQKDVHEKIQGGYGKYQGTWIPLEHGEALAHRNNIYDRLRPIFEFTPGNESPPPAPRHTSKPKAPKAKPAVPKWNNAQANLSRSNSFSQPPKAAPVIEEYDAESHMNDDDTPDNLTVASASYMAEEDRYDASHFSTGHRKRKREDMIQDLTEQQHAVYGDELLDYFLLSRNEQPAIRPDPPTNFQPDWPIDTERHTALHWASAMGDIDVIKQLRRFSANLDSQNNRGETPLMRAVGFTNGFEKQTFTLVLKELFPTIDRRDASGCTIIHHAAIMKSGRVFSQSCARYYLDNILNRLQETHHPDFVQQLLDIQDNEGNTAIHLAAQRNYRKCVRALIGRGAATDLPNHQGVRAEDLIKELNATKSKSSRSAPQRSSSPFAPDSQRHTSFRDVLGEPTHANKLAVKYSSEAANTVQSRITPLVLEKFQDLAQSYDSELKDKDEAEREARRILTNTQAELANIRAAVSDLESQVEPDDAAAKISHEATRMQEKVKGLVAAQSRVLTYHDVKVGLQDMSNGATDTESPEERLRLSRELQALLLDLRAAEAEYVEARSMVGTGDRIDKYRRLLKSCLGPEDQEMLDANLEDMIKMMEDESSLAAPSGGDAMDVSAV